MANYTANWEDDENNRLVEFSIDYTIENDAIEISGVTPTKVTFCNSSQSQQRTIGVHTENGRQLLARQWTSSPAYAHVTEALRDSLLTCAS